MIEWDRLAELRAEIGGDDLANVVAIFLEEADGVVERISHDIADTALEAELHFLKGSALNLGLRELALLCQEGERLAGQGSGASVDLPRIDSVYQASKSAILGALAKGAA